MTVLRPALPRLAVYIAAAAERQEAMREVRDYFQSQGLRVVSTWLLISDLKPDHATAPTLLREGALTACIEIESADIVVVFTEPHGSGRHRGGRHVELGIALALGKTVIVVGIREAMFHHHPRVVQVESEFEVVRLLRNLTEAIDQRREQAAAKES